MLSYYRQCPEVEFQRLRNLGPPDKHQYPLHRSVWQLALFMYRDDSASTTRTIINIRYS